MPQVNRFEALSKFHLSQEMGDMTVHLNNKTNPVLGEFFFWGGGGSFQKLVPRNFHQGILFFQISKRKVCQVANLWKIHDFSSKKTTKGRILSHTFPISIGKPVHVAPKDTTKREPGGKL